MWFPVTTICSTAEVFSRSLDRIRGVRNTGYTFNRRVPYAKATRGRRTSATEWVPIRIEVQYVGGTAALSTAKNTYLTGQLIPAVLDYLPQALSVRPVTGPLLHARFCSSS